ncbi:hydrolase [Bacilli bacterium]|nr:hydrolase [Bacilli bacterium]
MKKLYVFDFDGTIADTKPLFKKGILEVSRNNNLPTPDMEAICFGWASPDDYDFKWGVDKKRQRELLMESLVMVSKKIVIGEYVSELFNNAKNIIEKLYGEGNALAIFTARGEEATAKVLEQHDIKKYFKTFRSGDDAIARNKKPKPDPELLLEIMDELGFDSDRDNVFMIGDTGADIESGKSAKVKTIGVSWGGYDTVEHLISCGADFIVYDFMEIEKYSNDLFYR